MAGSPRKRARRELEAEGVGAGAGGGGPIPDAESAPPSAPGARRRPTPRAAPSAYQRPGQASGWDLGSGPESRRVIDGQRAAALTELAGVLGSSVSIRIFRLRPTWCAGFLEESSIELETIGELLAYLKEEWGGQSYRVQAITPRGDVLLEATLPIAGPPREQGRIVNRDVYEALMRGESPRVAVSVQPQGAPASPAGPQIDVTGLFGMIIQESRANNAAILESMRHQSEAQQKQNTEIIRAMQGPSQSTTLAESFKGVAAAAGELGKVGKALRSLAPAQPAAAGGQEPPDPDALRKAARENFVLQAILGGGGGGGMFGGGQQQQRYPRHPVQRAPVQQQQQQGNGHAEVPDALTE